MPWPFDREEKKRKKERKEEYGRELGYGEAGRGALPEEFVQSIGRTYYGIADPEVIRMLQKDPLLKDSIPAFSHLNRLTQIDKHEKKLLGLDYEFLIMIQETNMVEDEYDNQGWLKLESLNIFAQGIISDAYQGFKGEMITEQQRRIEVLTGEKRKRRLPL